MNNELFEVFREEATEAIARLQRLLMELETAQPAENLAPKVQEIFRHAHTIKGSASAVQRADIAEVAHHLESCLDQVRRGTLAPGRALTDASFAAIDLLTVALDRELTREEIGEVGRSLEALRAKGAAQVPAPPPIVRIEPPAAAAPPLSGSGPGEPAAAGAPGEGEPRPRKDGKRKKAEGKAQAEEAAVALFQQLAMLGRGEVHDKGLQVAAAAEHLAKAVRGQKSKRLTRVVDAVRDALTSASQRQGVKGTLIEAALLAADYIQSDLGPGASDEEAEAVIAVLASASSEPPAGRGAGAAGEGAPAEKQDGQRAQEASRAADAAKGAAAAPGATSSAAASGPVASVRVPVSLLDAILYRLDELIAVKLRIDHQRRQVEEVQESIEGMLTRVRLGAGTEAMPVEEVKRKLEYVRRDLNTEVHTLGILAHSLQEDVKEVRMVPVGPLLDPFRRTVRELASSLGKEATLEITGEDVRVDKRLLELMRDPLLHLLRNAVDHGLERPAAREAAGKPIRGNIRINAESRESQILLEIRDDGRGIDTDNVRHSAVERGLVDKDRAALLTHREVLNFIFMPGFSTSSAVTETSGRGVGLDVVRENVARLGGRIEFYSDKGKGTEFILSLPLTLAAARGLFVNAGRNTYCIPLTNVDEAIAVDPKELGMAQGKLFLQLRRQAVPYVGLEDLLTGRPASRPERRSYAVIVALSDRRLALGVDELIGQEEVVVKALAPGTPKIPLVAGGTSLADGRLVTVLEPAALVDQASGTGVRAAAESSKAQLSTVLVADDALTTRTMISSVLERAGYRTLTAPDGEAAYALAVREKVDLVVSDVEMPGLDGLGLCRRIRSTQQIALTPVILITSLGDAEDLNRGAMSGASAYIVKKDFDPSEFLEMVSDFVGQSRGHQ